MSHHLSLAFSYFYQFTYNFAIFISSHIIVSNRQLKNNVFIKLVSYVVTHEFDYKFAVWALPQIPQQIEIRAWNRDVGL